jgi:hypothetical protein
MAAESLRGMYRHGFADFTGSLPLAGFRSRLKELPVSM